MGSEPLTDQPETIRLVPERSGRTGLWIAVVAIGAILGAGGLLLALGGSGDSSDTADTTGVQDTARLAATGDSAPPGSDEPQPDPTTAPTDPTTETTESTETTEPTETTADPTDQPPVTYTTPDGVVLTRAYEQPDGPPSYAVYTDGTLYLRGRINNQQLIDEVYAQSVAVLGEAAVVNEYVVDPSVPASTDGPLFIEDYVLFETGSAVISDEFAPLIDQGALTLAVVPNAKMHIIGHTDSDGEAEANLALGQARVQAILDGLEARGADMSRVTGESAGEAEPIASNDTEAGRAYNRRIEVEFIDFVELPDADG